VIPRWLRRIKPLFAWYDLWVGAYWDRKRRVLYLFPLPMIGVSIDCARCGARMEGA
jgi:hypothetical protein